MKMTLQINRFDEDDGDINWQLQDHGETGAILNIHESDVQAGLSARKVAEFVRDAVNGFTELAQLREEDDAELVRLRESAQILIAEIGAPGPENLEETARRAAAELARLKAENEKLRQMCWGLVANAGRLSRQQKPRWSHVMEATGLGSTAAQDLCKRAGFDPDEIVPKEPTT